MNTTHSHIKVTNITKRYGDFAAVDNVSFTVASGEIIGFVGANGAGKTTTISMLLGLISPSHGEVALFGQGISPSNAHKSHRHIGYAAGDMALFDNLTGEQYFAFLMGQSGSDHTARYKELCDRFSPQLGKKFHTLSRGNKQKIALIGAFITSPKLVVLDEPTSGLDPMMQEAFVNLIREEKARGTTIFMSSHDLPEVVDVCTRVLLMKNGRIIRDLTIDELRNQGGREVRLTTKHKQQTLVRGATDVQETVGAGGVETTFRYADDIKPLLLWLTARRDLIDVEISSYSLEGGFADLYQVEEKK